MCDEPNRAGDERLTGDMDRLPDSLAALGSSSSFLISWSNRSSVSRSLSPCVVSLRSHPLPFVPPGGRRYAGRTKEGWDRKVSDKEILMLSLHLSIPLRSATPREGTVGSDTKAERNGDGKVLGKQCDGDSAPGSLLSPYHLTLSPYHRPEGTEPEERR